MSSSQSERAYVQLLGRVGRYKEPCLRFVWSELDSEDVIDCYEQAKLLAKLRDPAPAKVKRIAKMKEKELAG